MKKLFHVCILAALLTACATNPPLEKELPRFVGKDLKFAITYLGYPDAQEVLAGNNVYLWNDARTSTVMNTVSTPFTSYSQGSVARGSVSTSGTTTTVVPETLHFNCTIRLIADSNEQIVDADYKGNACSTYSAKIQKMIDDTTPPEDKPKNFWEWYKGEWKKQMPWQ